MKQKITLLVLMLLLVNAFSQDKKEGNRAGTIFYSTVYKTSTLYKITVDLFELGNAKFIEAELYNDNEEKLVSRLFELIYKEKKYFIIEEDQPEKEILIYDINFDLENPDDNLSYPKVKIKIFNNEYNLLDFSQKIFY